MSTYSEIPVSLGGSTVGSGTAYTCPAGKYAIISIFIEQTAAIVVNVSGVDIYDGSDSGALGTNFSKHGVLLRSADTVVIGSGTGTLKVTAREFNNP